MTHEHRWTYMGLGHYACACGERRHDGRTDDELARDRERATIAFKIRVNKAMGAPTANLEAALEALG